MRESLSQLGAKKTYSCITGSDYTNKEQSFPLGTFCAFLEVYPGWFKSRTKETPYLEEGGEVVGQLTEVCRD